MGNRGYRRFVRLRRGAIEVDDGKVEAEARYDGKYVLRRNTDLDTSEVALQHKRLLQVERFFRVMKTTAHPGLIFDHWD